MGYDGWLISDITTDKMNAAGKPNSPYVDKDGNQRYDANGKPLYTTPGNYYGMYDDGVANFPRKSVAESTSTTLMLLSISTTGSILD